jgi:hypothetical protein
VEADKPLRIIDDSTRGDEEMAVICNFVLHHPTVLEMGIERLSLLQQSVLKT